MHKTIIYVVIENLPSGGYNIHGLYSDEDEAQGYIAANNGKFEICEGTVRDSRYD